VGGLGRLELGHLLLVVVCVIVWSGEHQRDRFGGEITATDEPLVSLKDVPDVKASLGCFSSSGVVGDSGC
jgi:hypothetical protein